MKFVCDRCQTRYSIADEKVRQKILRIRCKTCGNVIVVQGEHSSAPGGEAGGASHPHAEGSAGAEHFEAAKTVAVSSPRAPSHAPSHPPSIGSAPKSVPTSAPKAAPTNSSKAGSASAVKPVPTSTPKAPAGSGLRGAPFAGPKARAAGPPPPPLVVEDGAVDGSDPIGGRSEWYLAVAGVRSGPFVRAEAARKILAVEPGKKVHVWKEGMPGWKPSGEVSVIARELSLLRPSPPPPPPEPTKAPTKAPGPALAAPPNVAAMPALAAKSTKAPEKPTPIFPGKPLGPRSASISDSGDFVVDTDPGLFADITTKKAKNIHDLSKESDKGVVSTPLAAESDRTPPPVRPLPPVSLKAAPPASVSASLPAVAPAGHPPPAAASSSVLPAAAAISPGESDLGGFSDVIRAVAAGDQPSGSQHDLPAPVFLPDSATLPSPISSDFGKPPARPGLKYVVAACVIVALVILIVMVTLRMDSRKVPDIEPVPTGKTEPPAAEPPKTVAAELPKAEPAAPEKTAQNVRGGGKHGTGRLARHAEVAPAPVHQPEPKQPSKPSEPHRPNPFDEAKATVSQSQISAVVRSKTNQAGLKSCYERALKMDNRLTSGRIDVTVSIGTSGIVQRVVINAPASFILVEPCIKGAVKRWVFPPSSEEYATNFPLIMQGGM